jgi:hypothetical protein
MVLHMTTGRHLTVESQALASVPGTTLRFTVRDKPGGTTLLDQVMTFTSGAYRADFTATQTAAVTADACFEVTQYDAAANPIDPVAISSGVLRVSRPGDSSESSDAQTIVVRAGLPGVSAFADNGDGTVTLTL